MLGAGQGFPILGAALFTATRSDKRLLDRGQKDAPQEGAFSRATDTADRGEALEREADIDAVKVVAFGSLEFQPVGDILDGAA